MYIRKELDIDEVTAFIASQPETSKVYIGGDSERISIGKEWWADYTLVVVVHMQGNRGCKIFGEIVRERDYDQKKDKPRLRLMNEVMKIADLYLRLADVIGNREVEIHLDINPNMMHGSSCVISEATGYIKGMCNVTPMVKPNAFAASYAADRLKHVMEHQAAA